MRTRSWPAAVLLLALACASPAPQLPRASGPAGSGGVNASGQRDKPYVILVGFDGFRWDYLQRFDPPNFRRVIRRGIRAEGLIPVFPSKTFPNHYSIVTGLYAENHGIVANTFYDPARGETYALGDPERVGDGTWYRGEPIWVTAERQGMVAACFFWPGSEAAIAGVRPTEWRRFDASVPNARRVDAVLDWLRRPSETRPHVMTLYFSDVDAASHRSTSASEEVRDAVMRVDSALGALLDGIELLPIRDRVYVVLVSDHGMTDTGRPQTESLDAIVETRGLIVPESGPVANIHVPAGPAAARALRDTLNARLRHGRAYLRARVPGRLHYRRDARIGDVVVIMEEGYMLAGPERNGWTPPERFGMHGWDPALESMHAIFVASGPGVPAGTTIPRFENVHIYPWLAALLGLRAPRVDGDGSPLLGLHPGTRSATPPLRRVPWAARSAAWWTSAAW